MNAIRLTMMALATTSMMACGGGGGASSPEGAAKALVAGIAAMDAGAIRAAYPSKEVIDSAMDCKAGEGPWDKIERELGKLDKELVEMKEEGLKFAYKSFELKGEPKVAVAGTEENGCKFKSDVIVQRAKIMMAVTKGDETRDDGEGVKMIKLADKWYILDM
ncbi:MAG: hypothetical protein ACI9MR_001266 [Myxococcota bacterium]